MYSRVALLPTVVALAVIAHLGAPELAAQSVTPNQACIFSVQVSPKGASVSQSVNSTQTASFNVTNTGSCIDHFNFTCPVGGTIQCVSVNPGSAWIDGGCGGGELEPAPPGSGPMDPALLRESTTMACTITVNVTYTVGSTGGNLWLRATSTTSPATDLGSYAVTAVLNGPVISLLRHNGEHRDATQCVSGCFDAVATYSTVPYVSGGVQRSVRLVYRSSQARPMGMVQVDATDTSSVVPVKLSILLKRSDGTFVTFTNGSTELFYTYHTGVNRLAAQFDGGGVATGAYTYTVVGRSWRGDGTFRENNASVRVLILNEASSPFGAGWSIAGLQRVYPQTDGSVVITDGDGSIASFARGTTSCFQSGNCVIRYLSPKGDFTTVWRDSGPGPCLGGPCPLYARGYPAGPTVEWNTDLTIRDVGGARIVGNGLVVTRMTFAYNGSHQLVSITDSAGKAYTLGYDASSHLRWIKDPGGRVDSITVDASGNLTRIKDWAITWSGQSGQPVQFQYDANHRLVHWTDRRGGSRGVAYDFAGRIAADTAPPITANGQLVRPVVRYASIEQMVLIDPATGQGTSSNPGLSVDTALVRATVTNPRGYASTYGLNRFGAPTSIQEPLGRTSSFTLDSNSAVVRAVSPSGHVMQYTWSGPDLTQTLDSATGRTIHYDYSGHRVSAVWGDVDSAVYHWTGITLDSSHVGGAGWIKFSYGADGRVCGVVDPGGHTQTCYFTSGSGFRNTDSTHYSLGTVGYRYDGHGQQVMTIDQVKDTTRTVYDSIGRIAATIGPLHDTTKFFYDDSLNVTRVQDAKGQVYRVWPNALGWADSTADPAGRVDRYQYDLNGNRTSWTNRNGRTVTFTYDSLDQARSVVADGKTTTFFSDPAGRYVATSDSESVDTLLLDVVGRAAIAISCRALVSGQPRQCFRDSSVYEIRDARTLAAVTAPSVWGTTQLLVGHHYDGHQLLDTLTPGHLNTQSLQPIAFRYSAEAMDSVRTLTGLNNLTVTHSYPWTHRTDEVQLSDAALTAALGVAYNFDNAGRLSTRYHGSLASPDTARTFTYGLQGNLVRYTDTLHQQGTTCTWFDCGYYCYSGDQPVFLGSTSYTFDSVENRKDPSAPNGGLDLANRLRRLQTYRMDYDAAGNMTAKRTLSATDTTRVLRTDSLFWSAMGSLDSVRTRDSTGSLTGRVSFGYDGWGRRVRKSTATGTSRYLWEGDSLLAQLDTFGSLVAGYTYYPGIDNVATQLRHDRADSTYYYVEDYSRNVVALLARTGGGNTIDNQYRYEPFGNLQGNAGTAIPNSLQLAGREYDAETQLYFDRARYLDPALGRFVSEDPIGLDGGINLYAFVGNDPVNGWDPSGTKCKDWSIRQEKFIDKAVHVGLGWGLVELAERHDWPRWVPLAGGAALGLMHEGPWGKIGGKWLFHGAMGDHDFTDAKGGPCAGIFDTFAFMFVPILYALKMWPIHISVPNLGAPGQVPPDLLGGGNPIPGAFPTPFPFPNFLPPTFVPGMWPPGWGPIY